MSWRDEENRLRDGFVEPDSTGHSRAMTPGPSAILTLGLFQGYRDSRAVLTTQMARASFEGAVARNAFFTRLKRIV
jgi:hypothetical protein